MPQGRDSVDSLSKMAETLAGLFLILALSPLAALAGTKSPTLFIAEWVGYSNGVQANSGGTFRPDPGFKFFTVSELDVAVDNEPPPPPGDVVSLQFTATYEDGSTSTSGETGFFTAPQLFDIFPYAYWSPSLSGTSSGKRMKSLAYQVTESPASTAVVIFQGHGLETK